MRRVAKRYAKAFFQENAGNIGAARANLAALAPIKELFENEEAAKVLGSPIMPADVKKALLAYALEQGKASQQVKDFVYSVADAGRTSAIADTVDAYSDLIDEAEGKVRAHLTSATPLDDAAKQAIASSLEAILKKKIEIVASTDPALLGGFVVQMGNYLVDLSLKTRLEALSESAVQDSI